MIHKKDGLNCNIGNIWRKGGRWSQKGRTGQVLHSFFCHYWSCIWSAGSGGGQKCSVACRNEACNNTCRVVGVWIGKGKVQTLTATFETENFKAYKNDRYLTFPLSVCRTLGVSLSPTNFSAFLVYSMFCFKCLWDSVVTSFYHPYAWLCICSLPRPADRCCRFHVFCLFFLPCVPDSTFPHWFLHFSDILQEITTPILAWGSHLGWGEANVSMKLSSHPPCCNLLSRKKQAYTTEASHLGSVSQYLLPPAFAF